MKTTLAIIALALTSCITTTTETTNLDGTVTKVTVRQPATGSIEAATVLTAIAVDQLSGK